MNVIVANKRNDVLSNLDIDIIKNIVGEYTADELVAMFKDFYCDRIILDITALNNYTDISNIQKLAIGLGEAKLILFLTDDVCSDSSYLSKIVSFGIYNFTNNYNAIKQLIDNPNTYKDVAQIQQLSGVVSYEGQNNINNTGIRVLGIRNVTNHAGATTLSYMLKKALVGIYGMSVNVIEVGKNDLDVFGDKSVVSVTSNQLEAKLREFANSRFIVIDLNDAEKDDFCDEVLYLMEPSAIMLNNLVKNRMKVFEELRDKKIILNKSMLTNRDVTEFESEANTKVFFNIPPLDDRKENNIIVDLLYKLGINDGTAARRGESTKIFGIFRH